MGSAEFVVTQPRMPSFKLGIRFGRADMVKRFHKSQRTGFYLSVPRQGQVTAGYSIEHLRQTDGVPVSQIVALYSTDSADDRPLLRRVVELDALPKAGATTSANDCKSAPESVQAVAVTLAVKAGG